MDQVAERVVSSTILALHYGAHGPWSWSSVFVFVVGIGFGARGHCEKREGACNLNLSQRMTGRRAATAANGPRQNSPADFEFGQSPVSYTHLTLPTKA